MKFEYKNIAVIGTGVIGTGWIIRFLYNNKKVFIYDPNLNQKKFLLSEIKRTSKILKKFYKKSYNLKRQLFSWQKQHEENLTGTKRAHKPDGSMLNNEKKDMKKYETWKN